MTESLIVLSPEEFGLRTAKIKEAMAQKGIRNAIFCANANLYYITGRVFSGYAFVSQDADPVFFVKRPVHLIGHRVASIHKPENILEMLPDFGITPDGALGLELSRLPYTVAMRLQRALAAATLLDVDAAMNAVRAVKTPVQLEMLRISGRKQTAVYREIPHIYQSGMTDVELQAEVERALRLHGCLGQFRIAGEDMELFMGNILAGDNADSPSPYDFAMGGAGVDPSLPVGANGSIIHPGMSVMVDMNGNFTGYMTDMTRCFYLGDLPEEAFSAHQLSIDICREIQRRGVPGTEAKALYEVAADMARSAGLEHLFMGHRQHAGFVGHGVGIEINEAPVIAPRSRDVLQPGNVIAIEPKFVIPGTGAVGIENTYIVQPSGEMECITLAPEEIIKLD